MFSLAARALTHVFCWMYPAYKCYKIIDKVDKNPQPEDVPEMERWLMYWIIVGSWTAFENITVWLIALIPFYSVLKFLFFVWLSNPHTQGSQFIFRRYLAPVLRDHQHEVDDFIYSINGRFIDATAQIVQWIWAKVVQQIGGMAPLTGQNAAQPGLEEHNQPAAGLQQPPSLQDPASGAAQAMYGLASKYVGRYLPVAVAAIQSAANATAQRAQQAQAQAQARAQSRQQGADAPPHPQPHRSVSGSSIAAQVPETIAMPIPRPNSEASDPNLRSRTFLHAQQPAHPAGVSSSRRSPSGSASLSQRSSQESVQTRSSGGLGGRDMGSFEQIQPEEVADLGVGGDDRPGMSKRRSSWFSGWREGGGTPEKERKKAE